MKGKSIMGVLSLVLTSVMTLIAVSGCAVTNTQLQNEPNTPEQKQECVLGVDQAGEPIYAGEEVPFSSRLVMTSSTLSSEPATEGITLTATVLPETATDKSVDFVARWKNAESEWANGKDVSEYVRVTQTSDGSVQGKVVCLQPFGEPIIITVTSRQNPSAKAECQVDYAQRVESMQVTYYVDDEQIDSYVLHGTSLNKIELGIYTLGNMPNYTRSWGAKFTPNYADEPYTISNQLTYTNIYYARYDGTKGKIDPTTEGNNVYHFTLIDLLNTLQGYRGQSPMTVTSYYSQAGYSGVAHIDEIETDAYTTFLRSCGETNGRDFLLEIYFEFLYGGVGMESVEFEVNHDTYGLKVEEVTVDKESEVIVE